MEITQLKGLILVLVFARNKKYCIFQIWSMWNFSIHSFIHSFIHSLELQILDWSAAFLHQAYSYNKNLLHLGHSHTKLYAMRWQYDSALDTT